MYGPLAGDKASYQNILTEARKIAADFLEEISERPIASRDRSFSGNGLPEEGEGALAALELFKAQGLKLVSSQVGSRYFGFVTGGATPASVAGDWLTSAFDHKALTGMGNGISAIELDAIEEEWAVSGRWRGRDCRLAWWSGGGLGRAGVGPVSADEHRGARRSSERSTEGVVRTGQAPRGRGRGDDATDSRR